MRSSEFVDRARRKMLGGGMTQAGIIAIERMVDRLKDNRANAILLVRGLSEIDGIALDQSRGRGCVETVRVQNG